MRRLDDIAGTIKSLFWIGKYSKITATATQDRVYTLPDKSGTFAMLEDVGGGGGVTAIGVTTANGVSGTSSGGTTPNLTIALGAITPSSVAATGNVTGANLSGTNTGDKTETAFNTEARAQIEAALIAGTNITLTPGSSGATRTVTIDAAGGGGGLSLPVAMSVSSMRL